MDLFYNPIAIEGSDDDVVLKVKVVLSDISRNFTKKKFTSILVHIETANLLRSKFDGRL